MLDCGFGLRQTEFRLARLGMTASDLSAIVVTHEHQDHIGGVFKLARRYKIPVWLSFGTYEAAMADCSGVNFHICHDAEKLAIGDLELTPYTVPHDAREPLQYHASNGQFKLGVLTDTGQSTPHMVKALAGCDAIVLECNHDHQLLAASSYPASLKHRIKSDFGHLSNQQSSEFLSSLDQSRLKKVVGAHLSEANNTPELVSLALREGILSSRVEISVACQQGGISWTGMTE